MPATITKMEVATVLGKWLAMLEDPKRDTWPREFRPDTPTEARDRETRRVLNIIASRLDVKAQTTLIKKRMAV